MDTTSKLTTDVQTIEWLALGVQALCLVVDLDTTHGEVEYRLHLRNVEGVIDVKRQVVEVLFVPLVLLLALCNRVVALELCLEVLVADTNLLGELCTSHLLHQATARVMSCVEIEDVGCFRVEDEANGPVALVLLAPHHTGDVVAVTEVVAEALALVVEKNTTLTTES
jgi:hypothetical protein